MLITYFDLSQQGTTITTSRIRPHQGATGDAVSRAEILGLLGQAGPLSRGEIARRLGLGPATVTAQVRRLMNDGYVRELPAGARTGAGRPRVPVELIADSATVIGMSVTPTSVMLVSMRIDGTVADSRAAAFNPSADPLGQLTAMVVAEQAAMEHPERVVAVGISVSGAVDQALSTVRISATLNWRDFSLGAQLQQAVGLPVFVANDLFALTTREVSFGLGRNKDDFLLLGLDYGVGLGIVNRRRVFSGSDGSSTEFGHMSVDPGGPLCVCGNHGCLQVYAGLNEVLDAAPAAAGRLSLAPLGAGRLSLAGLLRAADDGDPAVVDFVAGVGQRLGRSVGGAVNLLGTATIIVTGQTTALWEHLDGGFRRGLDETVLKFLHPVDVTVKAWTESEDAVGAAGLALHNAISLNVPPRAGG
ncbi:putative NBD/HSP70 family sugar kinase [Arthrobacter silviterrae]|uniref:ROK family transcriptional regulator n=1 Tax=Arthrobacter silviterrae TaxID=2026658 RepID=A0ABX0DJD1_9MICC|nr:MULTISPECIES: ROK family transcriptional regulator [Arthrobacter]MCU6480288.1 ROK family transcriptional regulator [Arthrobacter sp. A2-55]MDQ0278895.1 putative NBD/HSP70 family sugar kinase [Arthrobacter silviterrae]NGN85555.1 ROK family transcriptional regulator [Arthrobacter silviterrae]